MTKKRKAIDCKLIRPSTSNPGYFKYEVIIEDVEGNTTIQPAYGTDMQDAINRLIWNERVEKVTTKANKNKSIEYSGLAAIIIICIIGIKFWDSIKGLKNKASTPQTKKII